MSGIEALDSAIRRVHRMTREQGFVGASDRRRLLLQVIQTASAAIEDKEARNEQG